MRHRAHHFDVMSDQNVTEPVLALQLAQQLQNLLLDRYVEGAGRLVEHDDFRPDNQRARDRDPLPLAAREFVGVSVQERLDPAALHQPHLLETLDYALAPACLTKRRLVDLEPFADDCLDRKARRER